MINAPAVSVIIAAHQARDFINEAIGSALAQDVPLEILIAPDEPYDYADLVRRDPRVRVLGPVPAPTGPGPARNRALAVARGDFIALLDADDLWSPDYLSHLLPLAETHGTAFGRTSITDWQGHEIRSVAGRDGRADFSTFETAFASFHGLARRDPMRRWQDVLAEDVLFDLESLALAGGRTPFAAAAVYQLRQRPHSVTRGAQFTSGIDAGYKRLVALVEDGSTAIGATFRAAAVRVFRSWAEMNWRFVAAQATDSSLTYQKFVTEILSSSS
ncbi:MAG: glycosyltransferase family 2 protein [Rhodospirillaceae bacterium]|nr:glycosyltransferase family 2 protein [Rhodospirillaceae bacterium]